MEVAYATRSSCVRPQGILIRSFRRRGPKRLRDRGDASRVLFTHAPKLSSIRLALSDYRQPEKLADIGIIARSKAERDAVGTPSNVHLPL